jgi:hypothetical protein
MADETFDIVTGIAAGACPGPEQWVEVVPAAPAHELLRHNPFLTLEQITALGRIGIISRPGERPRWADYRRRFVRRHPDLADGAEETHG